MIYNQVKKAERAIENRSAWDRFRALARLMVEILHTLITQISCPKPDLLKMFQPLNLVILKESMLEWLVKRLYYLEPVALEKAIQLITPLESKSS